MNIAMKKALEIPIGPLMVDLVGETPTAAEIDFLRHPAVGAVILFARNYRNKTQVRALIDEIKALRSPALLVAVDQEGGRVQRFTSGFHKLPALADIGDIYDRDRARGIAFAEAAAQLMATEILQTGVDFSFAPLLDCRHPRSMVIGDRAFHRNPAVICELANAYVAGMNRAGMAATGKHFPGHGGVATDSHAQLPIDSRTFAEIENRDLIPFAHLANQLGGIMTAHVLFENVHEQPPTYASFWLKGILRKKLNFNGVIFSDDLSMQGAAGGTKATQDIATRCKAARNAGCDMMLVCNNPNGAHQAADGIADEARVDELLCNQDRLLSMRGNLNANLDSEALEKMTDDFVQDFSE